MAFSILRIGARSAINLMEKSTSLAAIASAKSTGVIKQFEGDVLHSKQRSLLSAIPISSSVRQYCKQVSQKKARKGYSSASESDSDDEHEHRPRAESEFWRRKMRTVHSLLDVNKDGVVSYDDFQLLADKFISLGHLSEAEANDFRKCIKDLWVSQWGEVRPYNLITVEQYLEDMHHVLNDKQLKKKVHSFLPYLFKAVDKDKSGEISVEEFKLFFECVGIDETHAIASFSLIDTNNDGKLSIKEFIKHGRDYFLTENETKVSKMFWGPLIDH